MPNHLLKYFVYVLTLILCKPNKGATPGLLLGFHFNVFNVPSTPRIKNFTDENCQAFTDDYMVSNTEYM